MYSGFKKPVLALGLYTCLALGNPVYLQAQVLPRLPQTNAGIEACLNEVIPGNNKNGSNTTMFLSYLNRFEDKMAYLESLKSCEENKEKENNGIRKSSLFGGGSCSGNAFSGFPDDRDFDGRDPDFPSDDDGNETW